jgi:ribosomal protein S1
MLLLELDVDGRKLSLGHKQTTANPWDQYEDSFAVELSTTEKSLKLLIKELQNLEMISLLSFLLVTLKRRW